MFSHLPLDQLTVIYSALKHYREYLEEKEREHPFCKSELEKAEAILKEVEKEINYLLWEKDWLEAETKAVNEAIDRLLSSDSDKRT